MRRKYGYPRNLCGVYSIQNKINGKRYIGASRDVNMRFSNHLHRDSRRYSNREFYRDIITYGESEFICSVLEVCDNNCSDKYLLEREQYWYDVLKPEYNIFRPVDVTSHASGFSEYMKNTGIYKQLGKTLSEKYNTPEYKKLFHEQARWKFKAVEMYDDNGFSKKFESLQDCARYITETTNYKGKNKTSKVKSVCDGERPTAYGYKFRYTEKV